MDYNNLKFYAKQYHFLYPCQRTIGFSNCMSKTHCKQFGTPYISKHNSRSLWCMLGSTQRFFWHHASCEGDNASLSATDKIENTLKTRQHKNSSIVSEVEIQKYLAQESGQDRLKKMFTKDSLGEASPEMQLIYQVTTQSAAITFIGISFLAGRQAKEEFIINNRATVFKTRYQAFRRLQDSIFLFSVKEGAKWAVRISLFSLPLLFLSQSIAVYRNKSSVWEYSLATAVTIGIWKANLGLRAALVGTTFGAIIGLFGGIAAVGFLKVLNETQEQRHHWQIMKELENFKITHGLVPEEVITTAAQNNL